MKLLKPSWVNHDGHPIFSVDIHPDGTRFATGGQGVDTGRVSIWNMSPVIHEDEEQKDGIPKLLCQMDNHLACVNCVRWSASGKYLASGGDDKVIIIWVITKCFSSSGSFGGSYAEVWRSAHTLRGHSGDILDLSWSPNDEWLASCSIDNSVIVWNTAKFPEITSVLRGHTGLVKGICWDPVGKYIASQSDDKTLKIWRTSDWKEEINISEPFTDCGGTTHVLRLNWSPDGQYLVSAHAMNNRGSTSQIIEREGWKTQKDFVGHRKAVTCVRFNTNIFTKSNKGKVQKFCCLAIGSRDRSLSVWLTTLRRPLVVIHDLFENSLLDISWSHCGCRLASCSWDGSVAFLEFEESEVGKPLSSEEKSIYFQKLYGKSLQSPANGTLLVEDADILKAREDQQKKTQQMSSQNGSVDSLSKSHAGDSRSSTSSHLMKGPTDKQIETRMPDGRRRITPLYIPPPTDGDGLPIPFNVQQTTFSSSSEAKTKIVIEKREEASQPSGGPTKPAQQPQTVQSKTDENNQNALQLLPNIDSTPVSLVNTSSTKRKPEKMQEKEPAKRKPGRPPQTQTMPRSPVVSQVPVQTEKKGGKTEKSGTFLAQFPALKIEKTASVTVICTGETGKAENILQAENNTNGTLFSTLRMFKSSDELLWEVVVSSKICGIASCDFLSCIACEDNTLSVFSTSSGRRLQPPIVIPSAAARLTCIKHFLMVITVKGTLSLWDFNKHQIVVKNESLLPLFSNSPHSGDIFLSSTGITDNGAPIVCLSTGKAFVFDVPFSTWSMISNTADLANQNSDLKPPWKSEPSAFPLSVIQSQHKMMKTTQNLFTLNASLQQSGTLSFIDQQLASSFVMGSAKEYRFWLLSLAQHLTNEGLEYRLRELCQYLLGPPFKSSKSKWEDTILGNEKHELLREVLSLMTSNLRLQRVYTEFKEQLELIRSKL